MVDSLYDSVSRRRSLHIRRANTMFKSFKMFLIIENVIMQTHQGMYTSSRINSGRCKGCRAKGTHYIFLVSPRFDTSDTTPATDTIALHILMYPETLATEKT